MRLTVEIDGEQVPLNDCDWVLRKPCGCVSAIQGASSLGSVFATEDDAWHQFYLFWHPVKQHRERAIAKGKAAGHSVELMRTDDAIAAYKKPCPPRCGGSRG